MAVGKVTIKWADDAKMNIDIDAACQKWNFAHAQQVNPALTKVDFIEQVLKKVLKQASKEQRLEQLAKAIQDESDD